MKEIIKHRFKIHANKPLAHLKKTNKVKQKKHTLTRRSTTLTWNLKKKTKRAKQLKPNLSEEMKSES